MKNTILLSLLFTFLFGINTISAQEDLLGELEGEAEEVIFNYPAFKAMKIANLQSTKVAEKGDFYMYISHRFGTIKDGSSTFFGLDNASTKIQFVYGLMNGVQLGISRESFQKMYAGSVKFKILSQNSKSPLNVTGYSTLTYNTQVDENSVVGLENVDRLSYAHQLLISRRFSNVFSFEIAPSYIRQNLVTLTDEDHDKLALGFGGRIKLSKRVTFNADYIYNFNKHEALDHKNQLSVGLDLETGGHVFQLLFSNSQSTNETVFLTNADGDWSKADVYFGFNIVRVF